MLLSMTGFGNATQQTEAAYVSVELKAVNNRYLKVSMRLPDFVARFETDLEKIIREEIARGSVQVAFRVRLHSEAGGYSIDQPTLKRYLQQIASVQGELGSQADHQPTLADLLPLPGVVTESEVTPDIVESVWPVLESTLRESLQQFHEFRGREGESMLQDLKGQCKTIAAQVDEVEKQAPEVVAEYREKILDRVRKSLADTNVQVDDKDVIREVAVYSDKCDINEEITRLRSHLEQFDTFLASDKSMGRKLEFLGQEMFREINTIGSKANNVAIAHNVVEMKAAIERIREVLQNVE